jgi:hypothetical protein
MIKVTKYLTILMMFSVSGVSPIETSIERVINTGVLIPKHFYHCRKNIKLSYKNKHFYINSDTAGIGHKVDNVFVDKIIRNMSSEDLFKLFDLGLYLIINGANSGNYSIRAHGRLNGGFDWGNLAKNLIKGAASAYDRHRNKKKERRRLNAEREKLEGTLRGTIVRLTGEYLGNHEAGIANVVLGKIDDEVEATLKMHPAFKAYDRYNIGYKLNEEQVNALEQIVRTSIQDTVFDEKFPSKTYSKIVHISDLVGSKDDEFIPESDSISVVTRGNKARHFSNREDFVNSLMSDIAARKKAAQEDPSLDLTLTGREPLGELKIEVPDLDLTTTGKTPLRLSDEEIKAFNPSRKRYLRTSSSNPAHYRTVDVHEFDINGDLIEGNSELTVTDLHLPLRTERLSDEARDQVRIITENIGRNMPGDTLGAPNISLGDDEITINTGPIGFGVAINHRNLRDPESKIVNALDFVLKIAKKF